MTKQEAFQKFREHQALGISDTLKSRPLTLKALEDMQYFRLELEESKDIPKGLFTLIDGRIHIYKLYLETGL